MSVYKWSPGAHHYARVLPRLNTLVLSPDCQRWSDGLVEEQCLMRPTRWNVDTILRRRSSVADFQTAVAFDPNGGHKCFLPVSGCVSDPNGTSNPFDIASFLSLNRADGREDPSVC